MKKKLWIAALVGALVLVALPVSNLVAGLPRSRLAAVEARDPHMDRGLEILARRCAGCHTPDADLPLYATWPVAEGLIDDDRAQAVAHVDFLRELDLPAGRVPSPVVLARLEHVLDQGSMPPGRFLLMHWNGDLTDEEEQALYTWIRETRRQHFSTDGADASFATQPLQPVSEPIGLHPAKVALGERLFHDPRLSGDQTLSCSSCHSFELGGCDRNPVAVGVEGRLGTRNVPTVFNAALNVAFAWDGRAASLADQVDLPLTSPREMDGSWLQAIQRLGEDTPFRTAFETVYRDGLTRENLADAIAEYERSLVTVDAPFDRYLRGEPAAIGAEAQAGHALFVSTGCATCHVGPALGGQSFEVLGLRRPWPGPGATNPAADEGRFRVTGQARDRNRFKVPTLRNVALTPPYFHDGSVARLDQAVQAMARHQLDVELTPQQLDRMVSFLQTLTGTYQGVELH